MKKKILVACLCVALAVLTIAGTTLAYLTATTGPVTNTFTVGNIDITLTETKPDNNQAKIIPGVDIEKDPKVTVMANSEACWLFVKVEETGTFVANKVTYAIADGWTALPGVNGVYYREVSAVTANTDFYVLKDNKITVSSELTKTEIPTAPATLTFTAYAVQKDGIDDVATAWAKANPTPTV